MIHRQQNAGTLYLSSGDIAARRGSVPSLDGLRAVSISIVLLAHFVNPKLFPGGLGVEVFFIISGFLITRLLLAEQRDTGTVSLRMFYVRRICRLYPVIIVFAGVVIGLATSPTISMCIWKAADRPCKCPSASFGRCRSRNTSIFCFQ
jgi:peptidoglycan/LPS O-acetylase OafA/YrhL